MSLYLKTDPFVINFRMSIIGNSVSGPHEFECVMKVTCKVKIMFGKIQMIMFCFNNATVQQMLFLSHSVTQVLNNKPHFLRDILHERPQKEGVNRIKACSLIRQH